MNMNKRIPYNNRSLPNFIQVSQHLGKKADVLDLLDRIALLPDFDSEQFMWPNIEEILLTMFLFLR